MYETVRDIVMLILFSALMVYLLIRVVDHMKRRWKTRSNGGLR